MYKNEAIFKYFDGMAIYWYVSIFEVFLEVLQYVYVKVLEKYFIQIEVCVDVEVFKWKNDVWYWFKEVIDWGWDWVLEDQKYLYLKYVLVYCYVCDIIGCFNNWVDGWVDWNMVFNWQGGFNWFKNWCVALVIVDFDQDEVYFMFFYYIMVYFSKFICFGVICIGFENLDDEIMVMVVRNLDGSVVVVVFNFIE